MPMLRRTGRTGDLRAVVNVVIPKHLDKHQRKLLKELAGTMTDRNLHSDETVVGKLKRLFGQS
jgi:molecular chaperone DnaJ